MCNLQANIVQPYIWHQIPALLKGEFVHGNGRTLDSVSYDLA